MPANMDIEVQRNGSYSQSWTFLDKNTREPLDLTGWTFKLDVKRNAGASEVIASAVIDQIDIADASINVTIPGSAFSAIEGAQETVTLAYDLLIRDSANLPVVQTRGNVYLTPGVSF